MYNESLNAEKIIGMTFDEAEEFLISQGQTVKLRIASIDGNKIPHSGTTKNIISIYIVDGFIERFFIT